MHWHDAWLLKTFIAYFCYFPLSKVQLTMVAEDGEAMATLSPLSILPIMHFTYQSARLEDLIKWSLWN